MTASMAVAVIMLWSLNFPSATASPPKNRVGAEKLGSTGRRTGQAGPSGKVNQP